MKPYQAKTSKLAGTSYIEIERKARYLHNKAAARTKRSPYVRSTYFNKDKIFITIFWEHLNQHPRRDRKRRLRYYACALELLRNAKVEPVTKENPNKYGELFHRFAGLSSEGELFYVQVKEVRRTDRKYFMSVFPPN